MFWMRNKENKFPIPTLIWRPGINKYLRQYGSAQDGDFDAHKPSINAIPNEGDKIEYL